MKSLRVISAALLMTILAASVPMGRLRAADAGGAVTQSAQAGVTLKVTVVISRYEGEKKTGSLPFVLMVVPNMSADGRDGDATSLQMGADVPVAVGAVGPGTQPVAQSWQYRSVGTNITATAKVVDEGRFNVMLNVTDSQVMSDVPKPGSGKTLDPTPVFQSFRTTNRLLMRDGQTVQFTAATDKTSGEVIKLDVTMNVVK